MPTRFERQSGWYLWNQEQNCQPPRQTSAIHSYPRFLILVVFCEVLEPSHVPAKFLFGMRREGASAALALLDEPEILQQMRSLFSQSALWPGSVRYARVVWRRLRCRPRPACGPAAADH